MAGPVLADRIAVALLIGCDSWIVGPPWRVLFRGSVHPIGGGNAGPVLLRWLDWNPARLVAAGRTPVLL